MRALKVGEYYSGYPARVAEGVSCRFDSSGLVVIVTYESPTDEEIQSHKEGAVSVNFVEIGGVIYVLIKYGDRYWMDCPLIVEITPEEEIPEDKGYALTTVFCDARDSMVKVLRMTAITTKQSIWLRDKIKVLPKKTVSQILAAAGVVQRQFSTKELVGLAEV
ncbi:MAG: hypothetical protein GX900_06575 [Clostridiaceae bacterium]|jgi:hypothetical protein|nr:hypothetical protein [Clostridiaceae bacterium]